MDMRKKLLMQNELLIIKLGQPILANSGESINAAKAELHFRYVGEKPPADAAADGLSSSMKSHIRGWLH